MISESADTMLADSFVGSVVDGRYLIQEKIGSGGIGAVYLAQDKKMLNRQVVVKVLLENWLTNADIRRKFEHEKEALSRLDHPGIISILDSGMISDEKPYFVMPYVSGRTLEAIINETDLPSFSFCADVIGALTDALSVAHSSGILHRDIKPENIIITVQHDKKMWVRLIDFGIARVLDSQVSPVTQVQRSVGTIWYVAPEQLLGSLQQTPSADIYSLAVVAYVMLTGRRPFDPQSLAHMAVLQKEGVVRLPSEVYEKISPEIDRIIKRALAYDPKERYQDVANFGRDLTAELRRLSKGLPSAATAANTIVLPTSAAIENDAETSAFEYGKASVVTKIRESQNEMPVVQTSQSVLTNRGNLLWIGLAVLLLLISGVALSTWLSVPPIVAPPVSETAAIPSAPLAGLLIYFDIQQKGDETLLDGVFWDIERDIFKTGDKIRVNIQSYKSGSLYLFNEDYIEAGKTEFNILFPTTALQKGFPQIEKDARIKTGFIPFTGKPGKEIVWVVWTGGSVPEPDEARTNALINKGKVQDPKMAKELKEYLDSYPKDQLKIETSQGKRTVTGNSDVIVYRMELEHR